MFFAHALVGDETTEKRFVAVTGDAVFYEQRPLAANGYPTDDGARIARASLASGKVRTISPSTSKWNLANLSAIRSIGNDTVLIAFDYGGLWSVRGDATKATRVAKFRALSLDDAIVFQGSLVFVNDDGGMIRTDGTAAGTRTIAPAYAFDRRPVHFAYHGTGDLLFTAEVAGDLENSLMHYDGTAIAAVPATAGRAVDQVVAADGRIVAVSEGRLLLVADDLATAAPLAASRVDDARQLTTVGRGVAFLDGDGVFYSDLTTRGTLRVGDAPPDAFADRPTTLRLDAGGFLIHAFANGYGDAAATLDAPGSPAVYRLSKTSMTKVLDGSYGSVRRLAGASYFFTDNDDARDGRVTRLADDGVATTLALPGDAASPAANATRVVFVGGTASQTLYAIDPADATGAIVGDLFRDDNANGKLGPADGRLAGRTVFADYDRDGALDAGEPSATAGAGELDVFGRFTLTGVRAGDVDVVVSLDSYYKDGLASRSVSVSAGGVASTALLALPLLANVRVETFDDLDGDGSRDAGEPAIAGLTTFLDADGDNEIDAGEPKLKTDADGRATFSKLTPGVFRVRVRRPADTDVFTTPSYVKGRTSPGKTTLVTVGIRHDPASGEIRGQLVNPSFTRGFGDVVVQLFDERYRLLATTMADDLGRYSFKGLRRGSYVTGVVQTGRYQVSSSPYVDVPLGKTATTSIELAIRQHVSGVVFLDANGNGKRDAGEGPATNAFIAVSRRGESILPVGYPPLDPAGRYDEYLEFSSSDYHFFEIEAFSSTDNAVRSAVTNFGFGPGETPTFEYVIDVAVRP